MKWAVSWVRQKDAQRKVGRSVLMMAAKTVVDLVADSAEEKAVWWVVQKVAMKAGS